MLLNFQRQFARRVWAGEKRQTIRSAGKRVHVPKVGEVAHCYTGLRTRSTVLLGKWPISSVQVLRMDIEGRGISGVILGDQPLRHGDVDALAKADGFTDGAAMAQWFGDNHEPGEFYGWVIGWAWQPMPEIVLPFEKKGGAE